MKIVVVGALGMAGHVITKYLKGQGYDVYTAGRGSGSIDIYLDAESEISRNNFVTRKWVTDADFIINCIGVLAPDANKNPSRTVLLNSWWPHYLETVFAKSKTKIIHISTDCVFAGDRGWYIESDIPTETNLYGRSKAMGELNNDKDITLRMSIIGTEIKEPTKRSGLLNWVLNSKDDKLYGWENSIWNGITTLELAKLIEEYLENPIISGIYHLVPDFNISKYHLVYHINDIFQGGKEIIPTPGKTENKTLINTRNTYGIFSEILSYRDQLIELRDFENLII